MEAIGRSPRYYLATFGRAHAARHPVNGGRFPHRDGWVDILGISPGDVVVLTCTRDYPGFPGVAAGSGIVTRLTRHPDCIYYDYNPAHARLGMAAVYPLLTPQEARRRRYARFIANWIFVIQDGSYRGLVAAGL